MNAYDSERMADILGPLGYERTDAPDNADLIILNTCHIREKATEKVFSELGRLREYKAGKEKEGGKVLMAVAGCVAQAEGDYILSRAPYVDLVFGPQNYHQLHEMVMKAANERVINTDFPEDRKFDSLPEEYMPRGVAAFLSIQEGCDKFCTYCVVPYTRGAEYSRNAEAVTEEARRLVSKGVRELILLGQNVNAYHGETANGKTLGLGGLVRKIAEIAGLERIRYTTSHPMDMQQELIDAHRDAEKLMPYLHLPVQSGSDKILKAMNRKHTARDYLKIVDKVRASRPDIAMSCDFIVGFPGETDRDFEDTMQLVRDAGFASAYSFIFSPRPGTPAASMDNPVPTEVISQRLQELQKLLNEQQFEFNKNTVGRTLPVLFDSFGKTTDQVHGRTPYNQAIHVETDQVRPGDLAEVKITKGSPNSVSGDIL